VEHAYKYLIVGLAMVLVAAAAGTIAYYSATNNGGHGADATTGMNANDTILLTGDTPNDEVIPVPDIFKLPQIDVVALKARDGVGIHYTGVPVIEFLKAYGVSDFDSLVFYADDYELTINKDNITNETILIPYGSSLSIEGSNLPVNAGVKNIKSIVVIGGNSEDSLSLNDRQVSYGSMLGDGIDTMVYSRMTTGYQVGDREYQVETGYVASGISLGDLLFKEGYTDFSNVTIIGGGATENYTRPEVLKGNFMLTRYHGEIKLATADENAQQWITVDSIKVN
jgi:hypothetical protein